MQSQSSILDIPTISETESTRFHSRTDLTADEADLVSKCHPLDRSMGGTNRPRQVADRSRRASAPFRESCVGPPTLGRSVRPSTVERHYV